MNVAPCQGLVINAPEIFADPSFQSWLRGARENRLFTWFDGETVDEYSDTVILVAPGLTGEGSDTDMPAHIWERIVAACAAHCARPDRMGHHIMVRLTNLDS